MSPSVCNRLLRCVGALACAVLAVSTGCSRAHYRLRADRQAYEIVAEKSCDPRWELPDFDLEPDSCSRFYDPYDPDCTPLPPDDPTAHRYMHCVDGMRGWPHWDKFGRTAHVENPAWPTCFGGRELEGPNCPPLPEIENLSLSRAVDVGLSNSRDYHEQLENVYLSALSLTYQRYRFDLRPSGFLGEPGTELFGEYDGDSGESLALGPSNLGFSKLMPCGAQFVAELTNNTLWLFSGSDGFGTASTFAYSLVQPLMHGAGRNVVLERLTQAERNTLYKIRDFARFRKDFYVTVVTGNRAVPLPGSTGSGELAFLIRGERSPTVGFYHLLQLYQRLRNEESNVHTLEGRFHDLRAQARAGQASELDVTQLQSSLETARGRLLLRIREYENELDRFKVQLGLPPDMEMTVDDSLLEPFQFRDPELTALEDRVRLFGRRIDAASERPEVDELSAIGGQSEQLFADVERGMLKVEDDFRRLRDVLVRRLGRIGPEEIEELRHNVSADLQVFEQVRDRFRRAQRRATRLQETFARKRTTPDEVRLAAAEFAGVRDDLAVVTRKLSGLGSILRVELILLTPIDLTSAEAIDLALENRLDLMNRRAFVMDARRRVEIAADRLEATFDLVAEGEVSTKGLSENSNPLDFREKESVFRAGVAVVTPLDRRRQRNDFRAAEISYQRARRNFMTAKDQVKLDVRKHLRRMNMEAKYFEISRRALRVAIKELEQAVEQGERVSGNGEASVQGLNIPRALDNILEAQDEMIETWVDYETARMMTARDMGVMRIDATGVWPAAEQRKWAAMIESPEQPLVPSPSDDPPEPELVPAPLPEPIDEPDAAESNDVAEGEIDWSKADWGNRKDEKGEDAADVPLSEESAQEIVDGLFRDFKFSRRPDDETPERSAAALTPTREL